MNEVIIDGVWYVRAEEQKPKLKLVDWTLDGVAGCTTNYGILVEASRIEAQIAGYACLKLVKRLRIEQPKNNKSWVCYFDSPDSRKMLEKLNEQFKIEIRHWGISDGYETRIFNESHYTLGICAYRIIAIQAGYTDNIELAGE